MGLKGRRQPVLTDNSYFCNQTATRGGIVCVSTVGSGTAMDQSEAVVHYDSTPSGAVPVGMLMADCVNKDLTDTTQNFHKTEFQLGGKAPLYIKGVVTTDMLHSGITVSAGDSAYLHNEGRITNDQTDLGATVSPQVGRFLSAKDEDGYAKVQVDL